MIDDKSIDIVIPWVDDSDPAWLCEYRRFKPDKNSDSSEARYRDWNVLKYWFRSIDDFAPWVRKVHFVTWGHVPSFLDLENPRLNIVNHKDFIPEKYLPTFSSHTIELNLHRISGLSENFIYFNDDVYLSQPVLEEDFFVDGMPVDTAVMGVIKNVDNVSFMPYIMLNMMGIINMEFSKPEVFKAHKKKWYSMKYGKGFLKNIYLSRWDCFPGFMNYHKCNAFKKSTYQEVWDKYYDTLDETCMNKFRSKEDVNQYLIRYWQLCKGDFVPGKPCSDYITIGNKPMEEIEKLLYDKSLKVVCINDDPMGFDFDEEQAKLEKIMEKKFPNKSSFEI